MNYYWNWIGRAAFILSLTSMTYSIPLFAASTQDAVYDQIKPDEFLKSWLVLGPIPVSKDQSPDELAQKKTFDDDLLAPDGTEVGVRPAVGTEVTIRERAYSWRLVQSPVDVVDLQFAEQPEEFSVAYAWAELEVPRKTTGLVGIGSDDGVKVWVNGRLVHQHWAGRPARPDDDVVPVELNEGRNQLLLKIQNMRGPWGFAVRFLGPEPLTDKLLDAARNGDLDAAKLLLDHGVDVNSRNRSGLTAVQAARLRGWKEMVDYLASKGADTQASPPPPDRLVDALFTRRFDSRGPGAAVLVAKDGSILLAKDYGLANLEHQVPVTPGTKFRIGSVSKQFTAAAILKLAEEGKLSVQDQLSKFIPDYPRGDQVTIHHLLTHTSGIHSYTSKPEFLETATVGTTAENHIRTFKNDPYDFDPGQQWLYNNSGYFLLGYIIEKVSGQTYGDYLRTTFFQPLGMKDTGVHEATAILPHEATGYAYEAGKLTKSLDWNMSKAGGAGALYSTVHDLFIWNEAIFGGRVLNAASLKAAFTPVAVASDDPAQPKGTGYGYGWSMQKLRGREEISHGGGLNGFVSYLLRLPAENFTVAVLVNCAPPPQDVDPGQISHEIAEIYLGDQLAPRESPQLIANLSTTDLDAIVGRYDYGFGILTVIRDGDQVFAQLSGQPKFQIYPKSESTFVWRVVEAEVTFVKNEQGTVSQAIHKQGGQTIRAPKLESVQVAKVDPQVYDAYVGRYDYGGGKSIMTITRTGDRLFAQLTGQPKFEIFPKSETEFSWQVVNAHVTFVKDNGGNVTKAVHRQSGKTFEAPKLDESAGEND